MVSKSIFAHEIRKCYQKSFNSANFGNLKLKFWQLANFIIIHTWTKFQKNWRGWMTWPGWFHMELPCCKMITVVKLRNTSIDIISIIYTRLQYVFQHKNGIFSCHVCLFVLFYGISTSVGHFNFNLKIVKIIKK